MRVGSTTDELARLTGHLLSAARPKGSAWGEVIACLIGETVNWEENRNEKVMEFIWNIPVAKVARPHVACLNAVDSFTSPISNSGSEVKLSYRIATSIGGSSSCKLAPLHRLTPSFAMNLSSKDATNEDSLFSPQESRNAWPWSQVFCIPGSNFSLPILRFVPACCYQRLLT